MTVASALDQCEDAAGKWKVLIDRNRCEGKEKCAQVCPEGVFKIGRASCRERV